jgi:hypothetical protein
MAVLFYLYFQLAYSVVDMKKGKAKAKPKPAKKKAKSDPKQHTTGMSILLAISIQ